MQAVLMRSFGAPDVLRVEEVPVPAPAAGEVLVRVAAVEVSRTRDVATRSGRHPLSKAITLPHVLGGDFTGVVEALGPDVDAALAGRRVAVENTHTCGRCVACRSGRAYECTELRMVGIHRWGSYAQFAAVPAQSVHLLPDGIGMTDAAALAAVGPIALTQLRTAGLVEGSVVVVPGATGAVATVLAALAPTFGARVLALTRRADLMSERAGVTVLDTAGDDLGERIRDESGGRGADAAIDNVCAPDVFDRYFPALANGARIVVSGAIGTPELPVLQVPAGPLYLRSISLIGVRTTTVRTTADFWDLVRAGFRLPPGLVHARPFEDAAAAHADLLSGSTSGHTVLVVDADVR